MKTTPITSKTHKILLALKEAALTFGDLCTVIITMPYGSSYHRLSRALERQTNQRLAEKIRETRLSPKERRTLSSILSRLKKDGLIAVKQYNQKHRIYLTLQGVKRVERLIAQEHTNGPPRTIYPKEKGEEVILILFDIPEQQKRKRAWLREILRMLGFRMLQKSVWIGSTKIPKEFLDDLKHYKLLPYIEILAITKSGTLKDLVPSNR